MEKIYIDDDNKGIIKKDPNPQNLDDLKAKCTSMDVSTDILQVGPNKFKVVVQDHAGSTMYMASSADDKHWLAAHSYKMERKAFATLYYFKFQ